MNCYVVALDHDNSPYLMLTGIKGDTLTGMKWTGNAYDKEVTISIKDLENDQLNITHYYGLSEVTYDSIYDVARHYVTKFIYIKIHIRRYVETTSQYFFNKAKIVTKTRMELLQFMMDDQLDRTDEGIHSVSLGLKLYSQRLFRHPSKEAHLSKLNFYLDSLVSSGELKKQDHKYVVTGEAISTIERYEEEERRHTEAVKLQRKMLWLTVIAVIFAVVQSGVVKLPTIIDWSQPQPARNGDSDSSG